MDPQQIQQLLQQNQALIQMMVLQQQGAGAVAQPVVQPTPVPAPAEPHQDEQDHVDQVDDILPESVRPFEPIK